MKYLNVRLETKRKTEARSNMHVSWFMRLREQRQSTDRVNLVYSTFRDLKDLWRSTREMRYDMSHIRILYSLLDVSANEILQD